MESLRHNMQSSSVNVEVDAKPQEDLSKIMEEMRSQYENVVEKNRREMEGWYKDKVRKVGHNTTSFEFISCSNLREGLGSI